MDHLKEYVKSWIEFHQQNRDCSNETEEDTFEIVMEDIISQVQDYTYYEYGKKEDNG